MSREQNKRRLIEAFGIGEKTEVHVATPVLTASEDQGITTNPLEPELPASIVTRATRAAAAALDAALEQPAGSDLVALDTVREHFAGAVGEAIRLLVTDLHALLHPDQHPGYDPEHVYWQGRSEQEIATLSERRAQAAELWVPVARLYRSGWIQDGDRAAASVRAQIAALGDIEAFHWSEATTEWVADWIDAALRELAPDQASTAHDAQPRCRHNHQGGAMRLYKTTTVILSPYPAERLELSELARDAEIGASYCLEQSSEILADDQVAALPAEAKELLGLGEQA